MGYEPVNTVIAPGQFARRGGILDIWPPAEDQPTRMDFFGDEIETLRPFDATTQRTTPKTSIQRLQVTPAREFLTREVLPSLPENGAEAELSEFHIPLLHPSPASILEYLPPTTLVMVDNWEALADIVSEIESHAIATKKEAITEGRISPDFPLPYLTWDQIQDVLESHFTLKLGPKSGPEASSLAQAFGSNPRFGGRLKPVMDFLSQRHHRGEPVYIVSRQAARLRQLWEETVVSHPLIPPPSFIQGSLSDGWKLASQEDGWVNLFTDGEIFGWRRPQPRLRQQAVKQAPEASYADMKTGDWVVHVDHGIGRFTGLVQRLMDGADREYLCVDYAEGDQLYVPVHQADRLTRFIGPDSRPPSPSRLGGMEWQNVKARVKKAVEEIAQDLLELYAKRQTVKGYAFSPDIDWQRELEASFPYIETEDQIRVLGEVKRDMENSKPMDRLICGDVGYGKTEVALRAAFKAVMDSKQVALLVPTTVLAQQHYQTFLQRLMPFPVEVEMLSRFRTPKQQRDILTRLAAGSVDIIIGTHRLLQSDVAFKDMGLLIIDEEQRFGVTHKEFLKKMRTEVDVLTMTATPIPRTLYMALTGVRDISMISTPPEERLPIITHVGPFSKRLVRGAVLRELDRGGQVFFVHNRVQTIGAIEKQLTRLVPEARITIAHGQMPEKHLAKRMEQFSAGEIDVLLTTTIIESGLDIPNANTLIVDRADTFGLAQLYQLRGRVGRGAQRAYAYFLRHKRKNPTLEARQRLETIAENTQLGAGFSISMRDLEIRGSGDILGTRQHGYIAAVGFHLYTRLLADAVQRNQGNLTAPPGLVSAGLDRLRPLVSVDLPFPVSLPTEYIPDQSMRLHLYRRLANLRSLGEVDALADEFTDRFGPPPVPVQNLFLQLKIQLLAENVGVTSISTNNGQIVLRFPPLPEGVLERSFSLLDRQVRAGKNALWMPMHKDGSWSDHLLRVLEQLQDQ
jgi:transcription-repair coupling factor (superfamily II helicase)